MGDRRELNLFGKPSLKSQTSSGESLGVANTITSFFNPVIGSAMFFRSSHGSPVFAPNDSTKFNKEE